MKSKKQSVAVVIVAEDSSRLTYGVKRSRVTEERQESLFAVEMTIKNENRTIENFRTIANIFP